MISFIFETQRPVYQTSVTSCFVLLAALCCCNDALNHKTVNMVYPLPSASGASPQPPRVEVRPWYLIVSEGDSAEFDCTASGIPAPDMDWTRDKGRQLRSQVYYSGGKLRIPSVRKSDEGCYTCSASNAVGKDWRTVHLYVTESPQPTAQLTIEPATYDGREGNPVSLRCLAGGGPGAPVPRLVSSRQGAELPPNGRQDNDGHGAATLEIPSATAADSGIYLCIAVTATPPSYATGTVKVVVTAYSDSDIDNDPFGKRQRRLAAKHRHGRRKERQEQLRAKKGRRK